MNVDPQAIAATLAPVLFEASVLLFMVAGLALLLKAGRVARPLFVVGILCALLGGLGESGLTSLLRSANGLPLWVLGIVVGFTVLGAFGAFARLFMSRGAADSMVGNLASSLVRMVAMSVVFPVRFLTRLLRSSGGQ